MSFLAAGSGSPFIAASVSFTSVAIGPEGAGSFTLDVVEQAPRTSRAGIQPHLMFIGLALQGREGVRRERRFPSPSPGETDAAASPVARRVRSNSLSPGGAAGTDVAARSSSTSLGKALPGRPSTDPTTTTS